jgi:homogentisate 1,2-dioxygenase
MEARKDATDDGIEQGGIQALARVVERLGGTRVLLVTGPSARFADRARASLGDLLVAIFSGARRHVPQEVVDAAGRTLTQHGADTVVALGGGSAVGLAKALRLEHDVRFIAVPTTYAGSERTRMYGVTSEGEKTTGRDDRALPDAVVYDEDLTLEMPKALSVTSLLNALAHPVSALSTKSLEGEARALAGNAIRTVYDAVEGLLLDPMSRRVRRTALIGAGLAARVLETGKPGLQHRLAHALGGRFDLDHSSLHSVLLPHFVFHLRATEPALAADLGELLGVVDPAATLFDALSRAGATTSLKEMGVEIADIDEFLKSAELPAELVRAAFHGRRPSARTRREDWGLSESVSVHGPKLADAKRIVLAVHGRGSNADAILRRTLETLGNPPDTAIVAPQATDNAWYAARYYSPRAEIGPALPAALEELRRALARIEELNPSAPLSLFGFSQGACLVLELCATYSRPLAAVVALSGARIGVPADQEPVARAVTGTPVLLGASDEDPWLVHEDVERASEAFELAGCRVVTHFVPGEEHAVHVVHRFLARELLLGEKRDHLFGYRNHHESEALRGALPRAQNTPRKAPLGLYPEQINGTGFLAPRSENYRTWMYRIRPSAALGSLTPLPHPTFAADFANAPPEPNLAGFAPLPLPEAATDFVDGIATVGGAGSPNLRRGYAVHVYAANRSMDGRAFVDADGDLLLLPELGRLTLQTELGLLDVAPGELCIIPRGLRFSVHLLDGRARGYVGEVFGRHFELADRGPAGSNGLAEARHFRAPTAWYEDRLRPGYRITTKVGGRLYRGDADFSPYDVVAWHGNYAPSVYDLALFSPIGAVRVDHADPSIYTVVSAPLDERGHNLLDLVVFPPRWEVTEHTFRLPYFHRSATTEFNGIIRERAPREVFVPGAYFLTPGMAPHGPGGRAVERALADDACADRPVRLSSDSLWFQFESALPFSLTSFAREAPNRIEDWRSVWETYRPHFDPYGTGDP